MDVRTYLHPAPEAQRPAPAEAVKEGTAHAQGHAPALASDSAHVSQAAQLAARAMQLPEVRTDKVAAVQKALADGTYGVDAADVAGAMLAETHRSS
jgi:negative regulator of flagellin synthesis FlgM